MAATKYLVPYILITAFAYVFAKDGLAFASPFVYGALTALITCVMLLISSRGHVIINRDTLLIGVFYWLSGVTWLFGLELISAAQSAILSFTMPLFAIPLSVYLLGERASKIEAYGALVGFGGIILYNLPLLGGTVTIIGGLLTLVDAFFWALFSVYMRKVRVQDPRQTLVTTSFVCMLLYGAFSVTDPYFTPTFGLAIDLTYSGAIGGALSIFLWMVLIKTEKISRLTTLIFIAPIVTLIYGVATTGILPDDLTLAGVALIFIGIYASTVHGRRKETVVIAPLPASPIPEHGS